MAISYEMPEVSKTSRYTVNQAAQILGVHRNTITTYCDKGFLKFSFRIGKKKLILGKELIRFWTERHVKQYEKK